MFKTQFRADDQHKLVDQITGGNGCLAADDGGQAPGLDAVVHYNNSAKTDFNNAYFDYEPQNPFGLRYEPPFAGDKYYSYVQPPSYSAFRRPTENSNEQFTTGNGYLWPDQFHVQPPSYSAYQHGTGNSAKQFTDVMNRNRALVDGGQFHVQPPSYSALQHGAGNSGKQFTDWNGHRPAAAHGHDGGPAPDLDAFVHENYSAKTSDFNHYDYYGRSLPLYSQVVFPYAYK